MKLLIAADHIAEHVAAPVADMQPGTGRIRKHIKAIEFRPSVVACLVGVGSFPVLAPLFLDSLRVIAHIFHRNPSNLICLPFSSLTAAPYLKTKTPLTFVRGGSKLTRYHPVSAWPAVAAEALCPLTLGWV